jgi:hypothetical protein
MPTKVKVMPESNRLRRTAMMRSYINVKKPGSRNRIKEVIKTSKTVNKKIGKKKSVKKTSPLRKHSVKGKKKGKGKKRIKKVKKVKIGKTPIIGVVNNSPSFFNLPEDILVNFIDSDNNYLQYNIEEWNGNNFISKLFFVMHFSANLSSFITGLSPIEKNKRIRRNICINDIICNIHPIQLVLAENNPLSIPALKKEIEIYELNSLISIYTNITNGENWWPEGCEGNPDKGYLWKNDWDKLNDSASADALNYKEVRPHLMGPNTTYRDILKKEVQIELELVKAKKEEVEEEEVEEEEVAE